MTHTAKLRYGILVRLEIANKPGMLGKVASAIGRAGGLDAWQPTAEELRDPEFRVYRWLKAPPAELPVFVGHGRDDRFAAGMQAIAERFPANARQCVAGDHDWPAWRDLWEHFLDRRLFNA